MNWKVFVFLLLLATPLQTANAGTFAFTPAQIDELIQSKIAKPHGAAFANQGLGCRTYLWKRKDRHVFFFLRDGKSFGEYRDEKLDEGRFLHVSEVYLAGHARNAEFLKRAKNLPFVVKDTKYNWFEGAWNSSTIHWRLVTCGRSGTISKIENEATEVVSKQLVCLDVPLEMLDASREYFMSLYKQKPSEFEVAFHGSLGKNEMLRLNGAKVVEGKCELKVVGPHRTTDYEFKLLIRLPNSPFDASFSSIRLKEISSMSFTGKLGANMAIVFRAD